MTVLCLLKKINDYSEEFNLKTKNHDALYIQTIHCLYRIGVYTRLCTVLLNSVATVFLLLKFIKECLLITSK